jgi:DNA-directed RNA polymerase sigma subunit (sigma70/sigma32)
VSEHAIADRERAERTARAADELGQCLDAVAAGPDPGTLVGLEERIRRAREELVVANVAVATAIASRYRSSHEPMEELVQTADLGLVKAASGFVPGRGSDFLAYACRRSRVR